MTLRYISIIHFISLLAILPLGAQGFLTPGRQWVYEYNIYEVGIGLYEQSIETITVENDTIIDGVMYTKLTATKIPPCSVFGTTNFLREEGSKVYRRSSDLNTEFLFIDFEETVSYPIIYETIIPSGSMDTAIAFIDSFGLEQSYDGTRVEVQYMRIWNNQSFDDEAVYKVYRDIGFVEYGLLFPYLGTGLCDFREGISLRCMISGQDTIHFTEYDCFESSLILATQPLNTESLNLFPNPTSGIVYLSQDVIIIEIVDMKGRAMKVQPGANHIDISHLPPGIYLLKGRTEPGSNIFIRKIIKR